jgi:Fic family protein
VRSIDASVPPLIEHLDYMPSLGLMSLTESALVAIAQADTNVVGNSAALSRFMIRTESVASSRIERISASADDYARAIAGNRGNSSAVSMVAASSALHDLVTVVGDRGTFALEDVLDAHRALMKDDLFEADYAGTLRDMQNWVGGSDYSPRGALHIPPAPERVEALMHDLVGYLNRDDIPTLVQASIAHAQFESIHPFTDGNGRIGRALISAVLRRRGVTRHAVIPLASGILARREDYFGALGTYRSGDPVPLVELFTRAAYVAALESRTSIDRLNALPAEWMNVVKPRKGSALAALLPVFFDHPVMNADDVERYSGAKTVQTYAAIDRLVEVGVIREITGRKRDRVWVASDLLAELDELDRRIQQSM